MENQTRPPSGRNEPWRIWKICLIAALGPIVILAITLHSRGLVMSSKLDYYIYDHNFIGDAIIIFGVPGAPAVPWNNEHNGWDFHIPSDTQILMTSMDVSEVSTQGVHQMRRGDGTLDQLPYKTPSPERPYAAVGPRSGPISVDLSRGKFVEFWAFRTLTLCNPCREGTPQPALTSNEAVERAAQALLLSGIRDGRIPLSALEVQDAQ